MAKLNIKGIGAALFIKSKNVKIDRYRYLNNNHLMQDLGAHHLKISGNGNEIIALFSRT